MTTAEPDAGDRGLYLAGGVSALAIGIGYLAIIALYVPMGAPPNGAEARLEYIARAPNAWWWILGLSVLTDVLFLPLALALYAALKRFDRTVMVLANVCVALFVFLDLALTWTNYAVLIHLSGRYANAAGEARKAVLAAAEYPVLVVESSLLFVYNSLTLAIGTLLAGLVMRKGGDFSRGAAYLGIATGILGVIAVFGPMLVAGLSVTIIVTSVLTTLWLLLVGYQLCRQSRH